MAAGAPSSRSRRGSARSRLHEDKAGKAVRGPASHVDLCEGSRGKEWAQRPDSAVCTFSGVQNKKKSSRARPPPPSPPPLPPWLRWPAPLCASQGRFLSQLGVLGCVAACLYWSMDFLVAACTYLNIPPGHCSVFPASHSLPPSPCPPPPSSRLISNRLLCLTPSFLRYRSFNPLSNPLLYVPSLPRAPSFFSSLDWGFSHGSSCTFTPRLRPHVDERKRQDGVVEERSLPSSFAGDYTVQNNGYAVGFGWFEGKITSTRL